MLICLYDFVHKPYCDDAGTVNYCYSIVFVQILVEEIKTVSKNHFLLLIIQIQRTDKKGVPQYIRVAKILK
jgi:hypothetical protein